MTIRSKIELKTLLPVFAAVWFWHGTAAGQPNLTPYQPTGWSDKIVVTTTNGGTIDSTGLTTTNILYLDWAVINNGNAATANTVYVYLYLDGVEQAYFYVSPPFPVNAYTYYTGFPLGTLSAGTHLIEIDPNPSGVLGQTNASDNTYTKTINISSPNLAPYQPAGWSDKIVVAATTNTTTDSTNLTTVNTLYVNWAVINNGTAATTNIFYTYLYLDGVLQTNWSTPSPFNTNAYRTVTNYSIGSLNEGSHTIEIDPNPSGVPGQTNATDNTYTKNITVNYATLPATTLNNPFNGSVTQPLKPAFSWSAVSNAISYRILVATNAADLPSNLAATNGGPSVVLDATTTTTSFVPSFALTTNTTYYWEVHGLNVPYYGIWSATNSFTTSAGLSGLTIIPAFDSTITSDPQAATIEATINAAIAVYQTNFVNPVTVTITFQEITNGLGLSQWSYKSIPYSNYLAALISSATSADDATALAHLPNQADNPVNGNASVNLKAPLGRALGFNINPNPGEPDGTISLNTSIMNLSPAQTNAGKYSLISTVWHETDEVLGLGSWLDQVKQGKDTLTGLILPEDLFRYDQTGARSYNTNVSTTSYFSLDGTTDLAQFNQVAAGDFGDWYSYYGGVVPQVQDAYLAPGVSPTLGVELRALDAIGYNRGTGPEIQSVSLANKTITLTWTTVAGQSYQVQDTTNLLQNTWTNSGGSITATNTTTSFTGTIGPAFQGFYRVALLPPGGGSNLVASPRELIVAPLLKGTNYLWPGAF